ncbi:MAG: ATP-binding cassette domain-containing protein, partial [Spirochaetales bacterium]|nr:ATP-binding cassette domain-containing protein [Candidatus Physcosoma equi]
MSSIVVNHVSYRYPEGKKDALKEISLRFEEGTFVAILGSNGSGKSTLGKLLNALMVPSSGTILVDNLDSKDQKNTYLIRKKVGIVFQNPENQIVSDT